MLGLALSCESPAQSWLWGFLFEFGQTKQGGDGRGEGKYDCTLGLATCSRAGGEANMTVCLGLQHVQM